MMTRGSGKGDNAAAKPVREARREGESYAGNSSKLLWLPFNRLQELD
jgi:hypothetical protein